MCYNEHERVLWQLCFSRHGKECQTILYSDKDERRQETGSSGANLNERVWGTDTSGVEVFISHLRVYKETGRTATSAHAELLYMSCSSTFFLIEFICTFSAWKLLLACRQFDRLKIKQVSLIEKKIDEKIISEKSVHLRWEFLDVNGPCQHHKVMQKHPQHLILHLCTKNKT